MNLSFAAAAEGPQAALEVLDNGLVEVGGYDDPAHVLALWWTRTALGATVLDDPELIDEAAGAVAHLLGPDTVPANRCLALVITAASRFRRDPNDALWCLEQMVALDQTPHRGYRTLEQTTMAVVDFASGEAASGFRHSRHVMQRAFDTGGYNQVGIAIGLRLLEAVRAVDPSAARILAGLQWVLDGAPAEPALRKELEPEERAELEAGLGRPTMAEAAQRTLDLMDVVIAKVEASA